LLNQNKLANSLSLLFILCLANCLVETTILVETTLLITLLLENGLVQFLNLFINTYDNAPKYGLSIANMQHLNSWENHGYYKNGP